MKSVGFKEWALVCEALGRGEQRIILRKGGIAEGRNGFGFEHSQFFLFPTYFHEQVDRLRGCRKLPDRDIGHVKIRYFARVTDARLMTDWAEVEALEPLHILKPDVVRERFEYGRERGLHVAFVDVFRVDPEWTLADERRFSGCRSWVDLPEPPRGFSVAAAAPQFPDRAG